MTHPYSTDIYAKSLAHWGDAFHVPEWGCSVILRNIPQGGQDACGTYPLAILAERADLGGGLERLRKAGLVSVTLIMDEFHLPCLTELQRHFSIIQKFKTHHVRRVGKPFAYGKHHRYRVNRALRAVVAGNLDLSIHASEWQELYANLVERRNLSGVHRFPNAYFAAVNALEGVHAFGAWLEGQLVSAQIWVSDGVYVHGHLAASSPAGYREGAAYAVYDASMSYFGDATAINLGGGAGVADDPEDGLAIFKRGFANAAAPAYVCGAILDQARYEALSVSHGPVAQEGAQPFFPHYRMPIR